MPVRTSPGYERPELRPLYRVAELLGAAAVGRILEVRRAQYIATFEVPLSTKPFAKTKSNGMMATSTVVEELLDAGFVPTIV